MPDAAAQRSACGALAGRTVEPARIGLPSGPARVLSAGVVEAAPATAASPALPAFCRVLGRIDPLDPAAEPIQFQLNLPQAWNRKALQYGGGGYNGSLVTGLAPLRDAAPDDPLPLTRGYATYGTDSGHQLSRQAPNEIGRLGMNDEMLANYAFAAYKKVHDVTGQLIASFYGQPAQRVYYFGGSEGGREGLTMAQRFPADFDGIVSVVPVVQLSMLFQSYLPHVRPQFEGGWIAPAKVPALARFVNQACDTLDGLADGVVNQWAACAARVDLGGLRCPGGADTGADCLSDAQLATVRATRQPYTLPFAVANGLRSYPPTLLGHETTPDPQQPTLTRWLAGTAPPTQSVDAASASQQWLYGANFVRFFVTRDPGFDVRTFDPARHEARLREVSALIDSSNPDLSAFFARGGKLILRENMGDLAQSPLAGIAYFDAVVAKLGRAAVDASARLYVSPASTHTGHATSVTTGERVPTAVDLLDPLDEWVTQGRAPAEALVQTLKAAAPPHALQAARPMCRYPGYPHYTGGDPKQAASYACRPALP
ncbi:MAG: tannase/feruloyl esterase family alpha/beta hydrolase [Rubrivivax sp.]